MAQKPDFKKLVRTAEKLRNQDTELGNSLELARQLRTKAEQAVQAYLQEGSLSILASVQVEELGRNRSGIRTGLLRQNGCETLAQVLTAPAGSLSAIPGISTDGEQRIRTLAEEIRTGAEDAVRIRLDPDHRTKAGDQLLLALYGYRAGETFRKAAEPYYNATHESLTKALREATAATGSLGWLLLSSAKKAAEVAAAARLEQLCAGPYLSQTAALLQAFHSARRAKAEEVWDAFTAESVPFYTLLEELAPGRLAGENTYAGLPEELVRQVEAQEVDTTGLKCTLRKYQKFGVQYALSRQNVLLGDEMGLGKTVQAIGAMVALKAQGGTHFVVVCPASVVENWCREIEKHSDLKARQIHGSKLAENRRIWLEEGGVAVTNYESIAKLALPKDYRFTMLVADEAHYVKNPTALRTQLLLRLRKRADRVLFMTGTPLENRVDEMCSLISYLQPEVSAKLSCMRELSNAPQFREAAAPVYFRRTRDDVMQELPDLIESEEWCTMTGQEAALYAVAALDKQFMAMRQVSWNVPDVTKSSKAQRLKEIVEDAENQGRTVLVFSFFTHTIEQAQKLLGNRCYGPINGSVPVAKRQQIIDEFAKAPAGSVLLAQIQAGGTGLNIQSASVVVICEPQLKPSIEVQAIARAYRMGQVRSVLVYRLLSANTLDERLMELLAEKQDVFDQFAAESVSGKESLNLENSSFMKLAEEEMERVRKAGGAALVEKFDANTSEV